MSPTDPSLAKEPRLTLKVNCSGSWANVCSFPVDATIHSKKSQVLTACGLLYYASGGRSRFKLVDETGAVVAEIPARCGSAS